MNADMKFNDWIKKKGISKHELARDLDIGYSTLCAICAGKLIPGRELGWKIEEKTGIRFTRKNWE